MKHIFIFNAGIGSGKDTICNELHGYLWVKDLNSYSCAFKSQLIRDTLEYYDIPVCMWSGAFKLFSDRELKETPLWLFDHKTPRQALQHVSEQVIKRKYGGHHYGKVLGEKIKEQDWCNISLVSDGGFTGEIIGLINLLGVEEYRFHIIHINRDGCTFEGDTRKLLTKEMFHDKYQNLLTFNSIDNNGKIEEAVDKALNIVLKHVDAE